MKKIYAIGAILLLLSGSACSLFGSKSNPQTQSQGAGNDGNVTPGTGNNGNDGNIPPGRGNGNGNGKNSDNVAFHNIGR
jgi:hypothetical protein